MGIGDMASWFTGFATFSAVLTTLYLAYYEKRLNKKNDILRTRNTIIILSRQVLSAINKKNRKDGGITEDTIKRLPEYITFSTWLLVSWVLGKAHLNDLLMTGQQVCDLLSEYTESSDSIIGRYEELIRPLKNKK